jgi:hypothetical protein
MNSLWMFGLTASIYSIYLLATISIDQEVIIYALTGGFCQAQANVLITMAMALGLAAPAAALVNL